MSRIFVARHGESTWNAERRWTGHADPPLSEVGRAQAKEACPALRGHRFDAVASSTLVRAFETASTIASELGLPQLPPMRHFDERYAGEMSGMTSAAIEERWPGLLERWKSGHPVEIPGGEPWQAFVDRALEGLEGLEKSPGRILVISHMGVQRALEHGLGRAPHWYGNLEGLWVTARRISIRRLSEADLALIREIDRSEVIRRGYTARDSKLVSMPVEWDSPSWIKDGDGQHSVRAQIAFCKGHLDKGATALGGFDGERLAAIALLTPEVRPGLAQLAYLHVSLPYRRTGVASRLARQLLVLAREQRAKRVYVSATPSESAVGFYRSLGFDVAPDPIPELYALEPDDIHMILDLEATTPRPPE